MNVCMCGCVGSAKMVIKMSENKLLFTGWQRMTYSVPQCRDAVDASCCVGFNGTESSLSTLKWLEEVISRVRGISYNLASVLCDLAVVNILKHWQTIRDDHLCCPDYALEFCLLSEVEDPNQLVIDEARMDSLICVQLEQQCLWKVECPVASERKFYAETYWLCIPCSSPILDPWIWRSHGN